MSKHAPTPWHFDTVPCEGDYGSGPDPSHGFDAYQILAYVDGKWCSVADTLNSDLTIVHEEPDEDGKNAWDEAGRNNIAFIVKACNSFDQMREALLQVEREMQAGFGSSFGETREQVRRALKASE